jgi:hypothetical protein
MNLNFRLILFYSTFFISLQTSAQNGGNSPYSVMGIGDMSPPGYIRNIGMGGTGVSNGHSEFINIQNPALLPVNKYHNNDSTLRFTMLEAGFLIQVRHLSTQATTAVTNGFNINYFSFSFPISRKWTTSFGLRPYSSVQNRYISYLGYDKIRDANIISAVNDYSIKGSLNQVHFANGIDISKTVSVGLLASYIFGNINEQSVTLAQLAQDGSYSDNTGTYIQTYYSGFQLKPGIAYRVELKDSSAKGSGTYFNAGFTFDYLLNFNAHQGRKLVTKGSFESIITLGDTINSSMKTTLPPTSSVGFSLDKPDFWTIAVDFSYSPWSYYKSFPSAYIGAKMQDSYTISIGGEIKPNRRMALTNKEYRVGFSYTKSPITIHNRQLNDFSVSLGTSVPFGRKDGRYKSKPLTKINAALVIGNRGTTDAGLIREQYFRLHLGLLIHDKWFQRWRIE